MDTVELRDVSPEAAERVRAFLGRDQLQGYEGDSGTVRGDCIEVDYEYDRGAQLLEVTPKRLPEHLQGKSALREMLEVAFETELDRPSHCGIYTYCLTEIDNQAEIGLTYAEATTNRGTISVDAQHVEPGKTLLAFTAESAKGSTIGIDGTAVFGLDDGITYLTMQYYMVIAESARFTVGLKGGNAGRYTATPENTGGTTHGYTYMEPKVILSLRT